MTNEGEVVGTTEMQDMSERGMKPPAVGAQMLQEEEEEDEDEI